MLSFLNRNCVKSFSFITKMNNSITGSIDRAKRVQQNILEQNYKIETEIKLRKKVDFDHAFQDLQKEIFAEIARSLKKSDDKVRYFIDKAENMHKELSNSLQKEKNQNQINLYNQLVEMCQKARWQLLVHRQSCGFTIKNHELIHTIYKIPPKIV